MLTVAQCYAAPTTGWIKAMTIHSSGAITAHQGITGSSGRRLEEQADEHSDVIKEHGDAIEKMAKRIEMLEAALEKLSKK